MFELSPQMVRDPIGGHTERTGRWVLLPDDVKQSPADRQRRSESLDEECSHRTAEKVPQLPPAFESYSDATELYCFKPLHINLYGFHHFYVNSKPKLLH